MVYICTPVLILSTKKKKKIAYSRCDVIKPKDDRKAITNHVLLLLKLWLNSKENEFTQQLKENEEDKK